jgi:hypothetical protein
MTIGCAVNLGLLDWAAGVSGGIATLPSLGELKVRLLLLGHQLKTLRLTVSAGCRLRLTPR